ncbi:tRNA N(3)-methylcytidine methyltransferase METTL2 [Neocloeon triangulifer]|uniref:tRNA N(3)-methylcytidine methyltransferase METTL2 n=1 Tax=Neocloeon triangulifer TaxID=2078957 RepID=UPI00286F542C|nr:tRNA N(3)-methylcytidine methyltransferase METTL2 [Neocloeon triangulifer]
MILRSGRCRLFQKPRLFTCNIMDSESSSTGDGPRPQFGNRHLKNPDDVFQHNAWDDVQWDPEQQEHARKVVEQNSSEKMSPEDAARIENEAGKLWDKFYGVHQNGFFKNRQWLFTEFPELVPKEGNIDRVNVLEVGCGVGNTVIPLVQTIADQNFFVYGCDFSETAVEIMKQDENYNESRCLGFVCDVTAPEWPVPFPPNSLDHILLIFVLSAINPEKMHHVAGQLFKYLKPGGLVFFRDYGRYDMAQLRFKKGKCIADNFYMRGDGTRAYFFTQEDLRKLFTGAGFVEEQMLEDRRLQVNRGQKLKMYRVWIQAKFRKPVLQ